MVAKSISHHLSLDFYPFVSWIPLFCPLSGGFDLLWMDDILHHFETMRNQLFVGIYMGIIILGFLKGGALHGFRNHPQYDLANFVLPAGTPGRFESCFPAPPGGHERPGLGGLDVRRVKRGASRLEGCGAGPKTDLGSWLIGLWFPCETRKEWVSSKEDTPKRGIRAVPKSALSLKIKIQSTM